MRPGAAVLCAVLVAGLAGCQHYVTRADGVVDAAGTASRANALIHRTPTATHWSGNVAIPGDGQRSAQAVARLRDGEEETDAPAAVAE